MCRIAKLKMFLVWTQRFPSMKKTFPFAEVPGSPLTPASVTGVERAAVVVEDVLTAS